MKRFLRDVLVGFLASFLAAVAVHLLTSKRRAPVEVLSTGAQKP